MSRRASALILVLWTCAAVPAVATDTGTVLLVSDIHFDPFHDPDLLPRLMGSEPGEWHRIFATSAKTEIVRYGDNTNYPLLISWLDAVTGVVPDPDAIFIPGDFLTHNFIETFHELTGDPSREALASFMDKTFTFLAEELRQRYPSTPIVPALGNNDAHCGNYRVEPGGELLKHLADTWALFFHKRKNRRSFARSFPTGGYYRLRAPRAGHRLIVLNTVLWSVNYQNECGNPGGDPGRDQLDWLKRELQAATEAGEKVWLVAHIPPGIDSYTTLTRAQGEAPAETVAFWNESYSGPFLDLVERHAAAVVAMIASHIHRDSFELLGHEAGVEPATAFVRLVPSVTPVYRNNPAFQVLTYDRRSADMLDLETRYLDLTDEALPWRREYTFSEAYGESVMDEETLAELYYELLRDPAELARFIRFHSVSSPTPEIRACTWPAYWAGLAQLRSEGYLRWLAALAPGVEASCSQR